MVFFFFFQAEDGIRDVAVTGVQTCALPILTATRVANSAGAAGEYRGTGFGVSADVWRIAGDDVLVVSDAFEGADLPSDEALAALVASINEIGRASCRERV